MDGTYVLFVILLGLLLALLLPVKVGAWLSLVSFGLLFAWICVPR